MSPTFPNTRLFSDSVDVATLGLLSLFYILYCIEGEGGMRV